MKAMGNHCALRTCRRGLAALFALSAVAFAHASTQSCSLPTNDLVALSAPGTGLRVFDAGVASRYLIPVEPLTEVPPESPAVAELESLPPAPNSIVMGLGALGCLGAVQLVRSMKRISLGTLPDWYHTDAPVRIGHVKLFELDVIDIEPVFGFYPLSTSRFERSPLDADEFPDPPFVPTRAPRSPPAAAIRA